MYVRGYSLISRAAVAIKNWIMAATAIVMVTVALFVVANLICLGLFSAFPNVWQSQTEKLTADFNVQFMTRVGGHAMEWLAIDDQATLQEFFVENTEHARIGNVYEVFTEFKTTPWKGKFFNFKPAGYREARGEAPWPPSPQYFNVFFFGGSTTMGIGPDWATISSYFQDRLDGKLIGGKPVKVYNFGRGSYYSTQERILFQQLLLDRRIPDLAIFIDGLNDFYFLDGKTSASHIYEQIFENTEIVAASNNLTRRLANMVVNRTRSLPIVRAAEIISSKLSPDRQVKLPIYRPETVDRQVLEKVIDRYLENKRQIEGVAKAYGFKTLFVWQPVPGYKYDLRYHMSLNPVYGLGGHERSSQGYPLMAKRLKSESLGDDFLWLADIQESRREPLYMDAVHYTASFSKTIGAMIADHIVEGEASQLPVL